MSQSPSDNGGSLEVEVGGRPDHVNGSASSAGAVGTRGDAHSAAAPRPTVPPAQQFDYRRRSLGSEPPDDGPAPSGSLGRRQQLRIAPLLAKVAVLVAVAAFAVLFVRTSVVQPFAVPANAMAPTLQGGDRILVLKSGLLEGPIHRGEIVVFHPRQSLPCALAGGANGDLVLRVVALPGEVIRSAGNTIFVDGRPLSERGWYDRRFGQVGSTPIRSTTLAPRQYFVMADNRSDACDSRVFGPISKSSIVGKGIAIVGRDGHLAFGTL